MKIVKKMVFWVTVGIFTLLMLSLILPKRRAYEVTKDCDNATLQFEAKSFGTNYPSRRFKLPKEEAGTCKELKVGTSAMFRDFGIQVHGIEVYHKI